MPSYDERMAAIEKADRARRFLRELDASGVDAVTDYCHSRNITGEPSEHNRVYRASRNSWDRGMRGRAFGHVMLDGQLVATDAVKVTAPDGTVSIQRITRNRRSASKLHAEARVSKRATDLELQQRMGTIHDPNDTN